MAISFLIDMFNDDSARIRHEAMMSITKVASRWPLVLSNDTIQSLVLVLSDLNEDIRTKGFKMLGNLRFSSVEGLEKVFKTLFIQYMQNRKDGSLILHSIGELAKKHATFMESYFISKFLDLHQEFIARELRLEDPMSSWV